MTRKMSSFTDAIKGKVIAGNNKYTNAQEKRATVLESNEEDNSVYCDMYKTYFIISGDDIEGSLIEGKQLIYNGSQKTA